MIIGVHARHAIMIKIVLLKIYVAASCVEMGFELRQNIPLSTVVIIETFSNLNRTQPKKTMRRRYIRLTIDGAFLRSLSRKSFSAAMKMKK